jgi:hypothetical protein
MVKVPFTYKGGEPVVIETRNVAGQKFEIRVTATPVEVFDKETTNAQGLNEFEFKMTITGAIKRVSE